MGDESVSDSSGGKIVSAKTCGNALFGNAVGRVGLVKHAIEAFQKTRAVSRAVKALFGDASSRSAW